MRFPQVSNAWNQGEIVGLTVSRCGNLVETKPHRGFPRNGNSVETTEIAISSGFQQVSVFGKPLFFLSVNKKIDIKFDIVYVCTYQKPSFSRRYVIVNPH